MKRILLAAVLALPLAAQASEDLSYSYIGFGATYVDPDGFSGENGFGAEASGAITENFHLFGGFQTVDIDNEADVDNWNVGIGYNMGINDNLDLVARLSYEQTDVSFSDPDLDDFDGSDDGVGLRVGVRNAFNENFEGGVGVAYTNYSGSDSTALFANAQFKFGDWGIVAEALASDDGTSIYVGPRLSF